MKAIVAFVALGLAIVAPAHANLQLAQKSQCIACHAVDKKIVGPAFQDVAKKYAGKMDAAALAKSIKAGGGGKWGPVPMPAQGISDADALTLARWILAGAK